MRQSLCEEEKFKRGAAAIKMESYQNKEKIKWPYLDHSSYDALSVNIRNNDIFSTTEGCICSKQCNNCLLCCLYNF